MTWITAEDFELMGFFNVQPKLQDPGAPWEYNTALYEATSGEFEISFFIWPSARDVRLIVRRSGELLIDFEALQIDDLRVIAENGYEAIEIALRDNSWARLRLRPKLEWRLGLDLTGGRRALGWADRWKIP